VGRVCASSRGHGVLVTVCVESLNSSGGLTVRVGLCGVRRRLLLVVGGLVVVIESGRVVILLSVVVGRSQMRTMSIGMSLSGLGMLMGSGVVSLNLGMGIVNSV